MPDQALTTRPTHRLDAFASPLADPAVVHLDGIDMVVLTTAPTAVSVWARGTVTTLPTSASVVLVIDPAHAGRVLRQALASLNLLLQQAEQTLGVSRSHQESVLDDIRSYAIEAHEAGDICRDGLNEFLNAFDLMEYSPRVRVVYILGGTFAVAARRDEFEANVFEFLRPSFASVDDVDSETAAHDITLRLVAPTRLEDGRCGFTVSYAISGRYVVGHDDVEEAEADCKGFLRPDLDDITGLVTGTDRFTVEAVTADYDD